jgi:hypothetical protein
MPLIEQADVMIAAPVAKTDQLAAKIGFKGYIINRFIIIIG